MAEVENPLVSVIIPSKDRPEFVLMAIKSVLNQTYKNIEIIVVDDGSEQSLVPLLMEKFPDLVVCFRHSNSLGAPAARNAGVNASKGEYVAFLDDDDVWLPEKIERQVRLFSESPKNVGLIYCGFSYIFKDLVVETFGCSSKKNLFKKLLKSNFIGGASLPLLKKECFDEIGCFDEEFKSFQDWDMWLRISKRFDLRFIDTPLVLRSIHGEQITSNIEAKIDGREQYIAKHFKNLSIYPSVLSHHYRILSDNYFIFKNAKKAFYYSSKAFFKNPFNFINYINLFLLFFPSSFRSYVVIKKSVYTFRNIHFYG